LNVLRIRDVRQVEIHTAELLISDPSPFDVEIVIVKLKKYKSPGIDQIRAELIQAGGKLYVLRSINSYILFGIRKNWLINGRSQLIYQFTGRAIKLAVVIVVGYHGYQLHTKFHPLSFSQVKIHMYYWGSSVSVST
jgi:hypothetical protein